MRSVRAIAQRVEEAAVGARILAPPRLGTNLGPAALRGYLEWGAGPRAGQALVNGARVRAALYGRSSPTVDDVRELAPAVLRHRLVLSYAAQADDLDADRLTALLLEHVPCPGRDLTPKPRTWARRLWDALLRPAPALGTRHA